jgi:hypothetical protein
MILDALYGLSGGFIVAFELQHLLLIFAACLMPWHSRL